MDQNNQKLAVRLGFAALAPFVLLTLLCWIVHPDWLGYFIRGQLYYGLAILSFLGGLHWGVIMKGDHGNHEETRKALIWGVTPTLLGWASMINMGLGFVMQVVGFALAYRFDKQRYQQQNLPDWFLHLRLQMTRVVISAQLFTLLAANLRHYS